MPTRVGEKSVFKGLVRPLWTEITRDLKCGVRFNVVDRMGEVVGILEPPPDCYPSTEGVRISVFWETWRQVLQSINGKRIVIEKHGRAVAALRGPEA